MFISMTALALAAACSSDGDGGGSAGAGGSGGAGGAGGGSAATCEERATGARDHVKAALDANLACSADADCTTVDTSTECAGACSEAVSAQGASAVTQAVTEANSMFCSNYIEDGCPFSQPACATGTLACTNGSCMLVF
jgi:hypothetical protein